MSEEQRKSVHYRLPLFAREKLKKLAVHWGTTMTGVLVRLIERAKL